MNRSLYRCRHDRKLAGVASGVAEYFDLDPTIVRVVWFLSIFFGGLGIFLYIAMALIVPLEPLADTDAAAAAAGSTWAVPANHRHRSGSGSGRVATFVGAVLILLGGLALVDAVAPTLDAWRYLGPAFIVGLGAILVIGATRGEADESHGTSLAAGRGGPTPHSESTPS
ncbi:MAG TPA: PspC domain-containing protein [Candidatus Limnocylindrales bacterium]|nr:PspC domain-containing protein [Candidatus Limnocylindrales bacterium]